MFVLALRKSPGANCWPGSVTEVLIPLPRITARDAVDTNSTPGICRTRSMSARCSAADCPFLYPFNNGFAVKVTTRPASKPGSRNRNWRKLRTISPAPASSSVHSAIWTTSSTCRPRHPLAERAPRSTLSRLTRPAAIAGAMPDSNAVTPETNSEYSSTLPLGAKSTASASLVVPKSRSGGSAPASSGAPANARATPPSAPSAVTTAPSTSIWRISRPRVAPSASRTATSTCRRAPRASSSPAKFAHTINCSSVTQPISSRSATLKRCRKTETPVARESASTGSCRS